MAARKLLLFQNGSCFYTVGLKSRWPHNVCVFLPNFGLNWRETDRLEWNLSQKPPIHSADCLTRCGFTATHLLSTTYSWITVIYWSESFAVNRHPNVNAAHFIYSLGQIEPYLKPASDFTIGIPSITGYSIRDGQLLLVSKRSSLLLSHLIHLRPRSMGQLLKWPSEQRVSQQRFNRRRRTLRARLCFSSGCTRPQLSCLLGGKGLLVFFFFFFKDTATIMGCTLKKKKYYEWT